jgi:hypothetical protein
MVGLGMRTRAPQTAWGLQVAAGLSGVSPPAVLTERSAGVGSSSMHKAQCGPNLERGANQALCQSAQFRINDIFFFLFFKKKSTIYYAGLNHSPQAPMPGYCTKIYMKKT